jgi:hypothetical protein
LFDHRRDAHQVSSARSCQTPPRAPHRCVALLPPAARGSWWR